MTFDLSKLGGESMKFDASGTFDAAGDMTMHMDIQGMSMDAIAVKNGGDELMYLRSPVFASFLPAGKTWVELDMSKLVAKTGLDPSKAFQSPGGDPAEVLGMLSRASTGVQKVGDGTVVGVHATHYHADVDLAKMAQEVGLQGKEAQQFEKLTGGQTIPVDVWVDDNGYVREVDEHIHLAVKGQTGDGEVTYEVTEVGPQQPIQAPPADQAVDVTNRIPSS
jgi:hypothetical protein